MPTAIVNIVLLSDHSLGFPINRLKTGTPPRLDGRTIDWDILEKQPSDLPPPPFSYMNTVRGVKLADTLIECAQTYTNPETHKLVLQYQHLLPDYVGGDGAGVGPRYCPSLYKKVRHTLVTTQYTTILR